MRSNPREPIVLNLNPGLKLHSREAEVGEEAMLTSTAVAPEEVANRLGQGGLWLRHLREPNCLRACTHVTTTAMEVDQLLEALRTLAANDWN